ncbi:MAG TPA: ParA family protein [Chloroflexi bacterium]|nr:ParA family protein [Chloroflexota bacterium]
MYTIAIANHKGGVGKTATTHVLGTVLAATTGRRVLLVDMDPQSSLTGACGVTDAAGASMTEVLGGALAGTLPLRRAIRHLDEGLALAPADLSLSGAELGLVSRMGRENVLRRALADLDGAYDLALIDCPPSLGLLTINALSAAQAVLIPTQAQIVDLRGLRLFLDTLEQVRQEINPTLETLGILLTFFDRRLTHHRDAMDTLLRTGQPVLEVQIGRSVKVAEAATIGETVVTYDPENPQTQAYQELAKVVDGWLRERHA